jgi:hypothetical protein
MAEDCFDSWKAGPDLKTVVNSVSENREGPAPFPVVTMELAERGPGVGR